MRSHQEAPSLAESSDERELLLSSGFLAFARHVGFLEAVEEQGYRARALVGTSSGALVGSLWAAGARGGALRELLSARQPLSYLTLRLWRGLFSLEPMIDFLREELPSTFEELPFPVAVGVVDAEGQHKLISSGPLPEAVAASCAVPYLFRAVEVSGERLCDGGLIDRVAWEAWREWRPHAPPHEALVHWVERSKGRDVPPPAGARVVCSPRSHAKLWRLGPFEEQAEESRALTSALLRAQRDA
jgi:hypothetical protein